jgi:glycosyltransferase involved in cell wall biosynthesis
MKEYPCSVTIGIPVYNAEKYVERCLISVLNQTFTDLEILLVDDCGTDNSILRAEALAKTYANGNKIRICHHDRNRGVAEARNTILDEAKGKYIYFMDSDDCISEDAIEKLYNKAETTDAETVWGSFVNKEFETERVLPAINGLGKYPDLELFGEDQLALYGCQDIKEHLQQSIWNILYRSDFLHKNNLRFEQHGSFDDGIFQAAMQPLVKRAVLMSACTYYYYHRPDSLTHVVNRKGFRIEEAINAIEAIDCHRRICKSLAEKEYFDCRSTKVMKEAFYIAVGIIKHRDEMNGQVSNKQVKGIMKHPATLLQIIQFHHYRMLNLFFYLLSVLPSCVFVRIIGLMAHRKQLM